MFGTRLWFLILLLTGIFTSTAFAQGEANNWYFGHNAGITFNSGAPVALTNGQLHGYEGCAVSSDKYGNLLFYTDGIKVWNKNHVTMPNGTGLLGDSSTTQTLIVQQPGNPNLYYIFAADAYGHAKGLTYSVVDMSLNAGLGDVTATKNVLMFTPATEKMTAVKHSNGCDIWMITHQLNSNEFDAYLITSAGLSAAPVISNTGIVHTTLGGLGAIGYMKPSVDGKRLALGVSKVTGGPPDQYDTFQVLDFDPSTGIVSNPMTLTPNVASSIGSYGVEFSPDGTRLYVTCAANGAGGMPLTQFDLTLGGQAAINASATVVGSTTSFELDALQMAPDGKIYGARFGSAWLAVINNPNALGVACNYVDNGVDLLGRQCRLGLPNFVSSHFKPAAQINSTGNCPVSFNASDTTGATSIKWDFGDPSSGSDNSSTSYQPSHTFSSGGGYTVKAIIYKNCGNDTLVQTVNATNCGPMTLQSVSTNITCNGASDGTATATVSSGNPLYTYHWSTGGTVVTTQASNEVTNLNVGTYTVTITDATGATITTVVSITSPSAISTTTSSTNSSCSTNDGTASVTATGGTGTLSYLWNTGSTAQTISNRAAGSYTVTVTDANNCSKTNVITIGSSAAPVINSLSGNPLTCNGNSSGTAAVSASGGTGALTYSWSNAISGVTSITGLTAGAYVVTVTDATGCKAVSTINITEPTAIGIVNIATTNSSCGASTGSATATAAGGTGTLTYTWSNLISGQTNSNLAANTYTLTVEDANSCSVTQVASISNIGAPVINSVTIINEQCNGNSMGSAVVNASGGTGTLTYTWSDGESGTTASGLSAKNYIVTVVDGGGCQQVSNVTITEPSAVQINNVNITNASCGKNNGGAVVSASGGTAGLTYSWSNLISGATASGLTAGNFTVTVTDANNCATMSTVAINSTTGPTATLSAASAISCNGQSGNITASATSGTAPYTYSWSAGVSGSGSQVSALAGTYTVTVADANGCTSSSTLTLTEPQALSITPAITDATCGKSDGIISAVVNGGTTNYTYSWSASGGSTKSAITNVKPGTYTLTVTDANGCVQTVSATVLPGTGPTAGVTASPATITEGNTTVLIGSGGSTYLWTPASSLSCSDCVNPVASPGVTTTYTLYVKDNSNCIDSADITITVRKACQDDKDIFIANIFSPNGDGKNDVLNIESSGLSNIYWAIYDRWGNLLFDTEDVNQGWDGTKKGSPMETGTYVYYLKAICTKTNAEIRLKGNVSIIR